MRVLNDIFIVFLLLVVTVLALVALLGLVAAAFYMFLQTASFFLTGLYLEGIVSTCLFFFYLSCGVVFLAEVNKEDHD